VKEKEKEANSVVGEDEQTTKVSVLVDGRSYTGPKLHNIMIIQLESQNTRR